MSERTKFLAFVLIGAFASAVNLVFRIVIDWLTSYEVAIVLAFPIALTTAFLLNRMIVFDAGESGWQGQYYRFLLVNLAVLVQVFVVSVGLARFLFPAVDFTWYPGTVAHAIGLISPILTSYWAHKHFSFARRLDAASRVR